MTRDEISELLPFFVNGTLDEAERKAVADAVGEDSDLRAEVEALRALRTTMQDDPVRSPGEFGLARLMRDIDREPRAAQPSRRSGAVLWQAVAAIALALLLGQTLWTLNRTNPRLELAGEEDAVLTVAFRPGATEEQIRNLLTAAGAEIVAGPSALGFYAVVAVDGGDLAVLAAVLTADRSVVESVDHGDE
ncbi:MAG: hypothetical protein R3D84_00335 [Paracoccaceae bacterium]